MYTERLIKVLSSHRQIRCAAYPQPLTLRVLSTVINQSLSPDQPQISLSQLHLDLQELQAQGDILSGNGNRFCMALPTVYAEREEHITGVRFVGDRAYLKLAHQALNTKQPITKTLLHPETHSFYRIKERLENKGIRCRIIDSSVEHLSPLESPKVFKLQGQEWNENPFSVSDVLQQYIPSLNRTQGDRWHDVSAEGLTENSLLRLPTADYLWYKNGCFYEVTPDTAILTTFWLDKQRSLPIQVRWDEALGQLNLHGIRLPTDYAQKLWWLSTPDDAPRTRRFKPAQRPIARQILARLGCQLI